MYALRERRVHVTQEDFELAVAKVNCLPFADVLCTKCITARTTVVKIDSNCHNPPTPPSVYYTAR